MMHRLKFTPDPATGMGRYKETANAYWFQNAGLPWPSNPARRMVDRTTADVSEARVFHTREEAEDMLARIGSGKGWEIETV